MFEKSGNRKLRDVVAGVSAAAILLAVGIADAAQAVGKIKSVDQASRTLTLANGTTFKLDKSIEVGTLKPGQEVEVSFDMQGNNRIAKSITDAAQKAMPPDQQKNRN